MSWQQPQDPQQPQPQAQVPQWGAPQQPQMQQAPQMQQMQQPQMQQAPQMPPQYPGQAPQYPGQTQAGAPAPFYTPHPYEKKRNGTTVRVIVAVAVIALLAIGDWAFNYHNTVQRSNTGAITHSGNVSVDSLQVGDCFNGASVGDSDLSSVTGVPCTQSHSGQVLGSVPMTDTSYPSDADLQTEATTACKTFFDALPTTGLPSDASEAYLAPASADDFNSGDNTITCVLQSTTQDLTTSYTTN